MRNKYIFHSRIFEAKTREIFRYFSYNIEAIKIADMVKASRKTVERILKAVRMQIVEQCDSESIFEHGHAEMDESYFGARRVLGIRGRGARGKQIGFGLIKREGKVYTQIVSNCSAKELYSIIKAHVGEDVAVFTDSFKTYDGLVDFGYQRHYQVKHGENEFANGVNHINGIENFWGLSKVRLAKFRGISRKTFYLCSKECEFRFNYRKENIYKVLLKTLRNSPVILSWTKKNLRKSVKRGKNAKNDFTFYSRSIHRLYA